MRRTAKIFMNSRSQAVRLPREFQFATREVLDVLEFPEAAALHYAQIRAALIASGGMIGANDLLIAAHARSLSLTLVTNNTRGFGWVHGLRIENWAEAVI